MLLQVLLTPLFLIDMTTSEHLHTHDSPHKALPSDHPLYSYSPPSDPIPLSIREHWMRRAVTALSDLKSPCPFGAFGTAIVNHTSDPAGDLIWIGANSIREEGDPTLHGEIAAIRNCTAVLTSTTGPYRLSPSEALAAFKDFTLYTTAEACPMCASAIRQALFAEYVYATRLPKLIELGWPQIDIRSQEVFDRSTRLASQTRIMGGVLADETDELFGWQFAGGQCPRRSRCVKNEEGMCEVPWEGSKDEL